MLWAASVSPSTRREVTSSDWSADSPSAASGDEHTERAARPQSRRGSGHSHFSLSGGGCGVDGVANGAAVTTSSLEHSENWRHQIFRSTYTSQSIPP